MKHQILKNTLLMTGAFSALTSYASAATYFAADFDRQYTDQGSSGTDFGAPLTVAELNAGTQTGDWTLPQGEIGMPFQTDGGTDNTNGGLVLRFPADAATDGVDSPYLIANLTSTLNLTETINVNFDYGILSLDGPDRRTYLTGEDASGQRLFQVGFENSNNTGGNTADGRTVGYINNSGTWVSVSTAGTLAGKNGGKFDASLMDSIEVVVGATSYSILSNDVVLASGLAFRDGSAAGLDTLQFSANQRFTGGAFDNILVTQVPEPSSTILLGLGSLALLRRRRVQ